MPERLNSLDKPRLINSSHEFSKWLEERLTQQLAEHPLWSEIEPIALGSLAREELCPASDIDLILLGDEKKVKALADDFYAKGIKLRYRMPEDPNNWLVGVEPVDVLALLEGRPLKDQSSKKLGQQKERILKLSLSERKNLIKEITLERKLRFQRHESLSNYLEPNLKFGPGGLRDAGQALSLKELSRMDLPQHVESRLKGLRSFLLLVRQKLHLLGFGDVLHSSAQPEISTWLGYASLRDFMSDVQFILSEVSFYSDLIFESQKKTKKWRKDVEEKPIDSLSGALAFLKENPSLNAQLRVRRLEFKKLKVKKSAKTFQTYFNPDMSEKFLIALFRSHLMEAMVPPFKNVRGLVQHDQYHRLSVDAHLLQAVREVLRVKKSPQRLGALFKLVRTLTPMDWNILVWTALFHDLGKGRKKDHSSEGEALVKKELIRLGVSLRVTVEVAWMVKHHLILSRAAFREDPSASTTIQWLFDQGVRGRRINNLAVFTAIDIIATNPDAWNSWKETLLFDLASRLNSKKTSSFTKFLEMAEKKNIKVDPEFIKPLESTLLEAVPPKLWIMDYIRLKKAKGDMPPMVVKGRRPGYWVRLHREKDKKGVFLEFTRRLLALGFSVEEAYVHTYSKYGVYDWFRIRTSKSPKMIEKLLKWEGELRLPDLNIKFDRVELIRSENDHAIVSFRGVDQKGALYKAAQSIYDVGLTVDSARVHTWGNQIEDVFTVSGGLGKIEEKIESLVEQIKSAPIF